MKLTVLLLWNLALILALALVWARRTYKHDPRAFAAYRFGIGIPLVMLLFFLAYVNLFGWPY